MTTQKNIIWTISGSDCSGGAGIAADIKTGHVLGAEVCHLSTANTVQNSQTLLSVNPVSVDILAQQAQLLLNDKPPSVIKVGLLVNVEQVQWLCGVLAEFKQKMANVKVVYDPVGQASVGGRFSSLSLVELKPLLTLVDIVTPNSQEAYFLADISNREENLNHTDLARRILSLGVNSVIIKGGHPLTENYDVTYSNLQYCFDYCLHKLTDDDSSRMSQDEVIEYGLQSPKISTQYSHGGGCSFATALSVFIGHGHLVRDAFTLTKAFIHQGLLENRDRHDHYGAFAQTCWPKKQAHFPVVSSFINNQHKELPPFQSLGITRNVHNSAEQKLGLYPVIDSLYWLKILLPLDLNIIQLRIKNKTDEELESIIAGAVKLAKAYPNTRLFINDYWQLAIKHGAYGVHIGQEDLQVTPLDKIQQAGLRLGISTHGCYEFLLSQQLKPSYLAIGAIYPTKTKNMTGQIQGVENLADILTLSRDIPVVAIGGINHERAPEVLATSVDSIAVVTAITQAETPEVAVAQFKDIFLKVEVMLKHL